MSNYKISGYCSSDCVFKVFYGNKFIGYTYLEDGNYELVFELSSPITADVVVVSEKADGRVIGYGNLTPELTEEAVTLSPPDISELSIYSNSGIVYKATGSVDNYLLTRVGGLENILTYNDGMTVLFKAVYTNSGASIINVDGLGNKNLTLYNGSTLPAAAIKNGEYSMAVYNATADRFELIESKIIDANTLDGYSASSFALTGHTHNDSYYTESEVDTLLAGKSSSTHIHDGRYYTKEEVLTISGSLQTEVDSKIESSDLSWENLSNKPTSTVSEIDSAVALKHSHSNKSVLDATEQSFTSALKTKLDGVATSANNYIHPDNHPATMIVEDTTHRFATDIEKAAWTAKQSALGYTPVNKAGDIINGPLTIQGSLTVASGISGNSATATKLVSAKDITLSGEVTGTTSFDGGSNVSITTTVANKNTAYNKNFGTTAGTISEGNHGHVASAITTDVNNRFVTDTQISSWTAKQGALGFTPENTSNKGAVNGYAGLDSTGVVPASQLPSNLKEIKVVADIAARDAITNKFEGLRVHVTDATADTTVTSEWAEYLYTGLVFVKTAEKDSIDVVTQWTNIQGKPSSSTTDIDAAVTSKHSHANKAVLDGTEQSFTSVLKTKLDGIEASANNYVHPASHTPSVITQDASNRFVTDTEKSTWNAKQAALGYTPLNAAGGTVTGSLTVTGGVIGALTGNSSTATKLATASAITLTGDVSGTANFDGSAGISITTTVADDSHNHAFSNLTSKPTTLTGYGITDGATSTHNHTLDSLSNATITSNSAGEILKWDGTKWINNTLAEAGISATSHDHASTYLGINATAAAATKLATTRAIVLSGDVSGSANFDGNSDTNISVTVTDDSHAHTTYLPLTGGTLTGALTGTTFNSITGLSSTSPVVAGTATIGNATTAARADHVHPAQISVTGNAATATALATARAITLTGDVTGTANFDGTAAASITTTVADDSHAHSTYLPLAGGTLTGTLKTKALQETSAALAASAIDLSTGNLFSKTLAGATTFTISNVPTSGTAVSFILDLTNGGAYTITWFATIKWAGGTAPTLTTAGRDTLGFFTYDGGTTWTGLVLGKDIK